MKKLLVIVAVAAMFAACGGNKPAETTDTPVVDSPAVVDSPVPVDSPAADSAAVVK